MRRTVERALQLAAVILVWLVALSACGSANSAVRTQKAQLQYRTTRTIETSITIKQLSDKIKKKESFSLYVFDKSCPPCVKQTSILKKMDFKGQLYSLDLAKASTGETPQFKKLNIQYTPTLLKIAKGVVIVRQEGFADSNILKQLQLGSPDKTIRGEQNKITDIFTELNLAALTRRIQQKKTFVIYVGRPTCSDCVTFERSLLTSNLTKYRGKVLYVNVDGLRKEKNLWVQFKKDNNIEGTPSFVAYVKGKRVSSSSWTVRDGYNAKKALSWLAKNVR